uniref:Amelotin isoform X3 n=1 Tax=Pogona vitticeps TaxID=103695 RepID=A0ABM5FRN6_9SAUR
MKIVILLLFSVGLTFSLPYNQFGRLLATSNSREILRLMQKYRAQGNNPQQTQQRPNPGTGLPPAKLIPDQHPLANQVPNEVVPFAWPNFPNFPVLPAQTPLEQNVAGYNVLPLPQMFPLDINSLVALLAALSGTETLPLPGGGLTVPAPPMLPVLFTQMGPQGQVLSSEEMPPSQLFAGVLLPGTQGGLLPVGQAGTHSEGQEGFLPAGQTGTNQGNLPLPEGTAAGIQKASPATSDSLNEPVGGLYPTPSGFRQPSAVTNAVFVEPTGGINMEPSELREPPTTLVRLNKSDNQKHQNLFQAFLRGDNHMPITTTESKPWKAP